jgi:hypothetical protein
MTPDESQAGQCATKATVYVDDRELERRTPIRRITWQTWRRRGAGPPFYKVGRRCVYRWTEVVAWLESHRGGGTAAGEPARGRRVPAPLHRCGSTPEACASPTVTRHAP